MNTHIYLINIYNKIRPRERRAYTVGNECVHRHICVFKHSCTRPNISGDGPAWKQIICIENRGSKN